MSLTQSTLGNRRYDRVRPIVLPRRQSYHPSPADWRDEVIYFLLPDRFSDAKESDRPLLNVNNRAAFRPTYFGYNT